jgi:hypothetical protein
MYKIVDGKVTILIKGMSYKPKPCFFAGTTLDKDGTLRILFWGPREHEARFNPCIQESEGCTNVGGSFHSVC